MQMRPKLIMQIQRGHVDRHVLSFSDTWEHAPHNFRARARERRNLHNGVLCTPDIIRAIVRRQTCFQPVHGVSRTPATRGNPRSLPGRSTMCVIERHCLCSSQASRRQGWPGVLAPCLGVLRAYVEGDISSDAWYTVSFEHRLGFAGSCTVTSWDTAGIIAGHVICEVTTSPGWLEEFSDCLFSCRNKVSGFLAARPGRGSLR